MPVEVTGGRDSKLWKSPNAVRTIRMDRFIRIIWTTKTDRGVPSVHNERLSYVNATRAIESVMLTILELSTKGPIVRPNTPTRSPVMLGADVTEIVLVQPRS